MYPATVGTTFEDEDSAIATMAITKMVRRIERMPEAIIRIK